MRISLAVLTAFSFVICSLFSQPVSAQKVYLDTFKTHYEDLAKSANEQKCMVCHPDKDSKKIRNDYGKAVEAALGEKKVKDAEKIKAALTKAEEEKSAVDGKTFGDLIKDGKLPNATE